MFTAFLCWLTGHDPVAALPPSTYPLDPSNEDGPWVFDIVERCSRCGEPVVIRERVPAAQYAEYVALAFGGGLA